MKKSVSPIASRFTLGALAVSALTLWVAAPLAHADPTSYSPQNDSPTAGDYRSAASAAWNVNSTWSSYDGSSWVGASSTPSTGHRVDILNGNTVTMPTSLKVTINEIVVDAGGTLTISGKTGICTLSSAGNGYADLDIYGTVNLGSATSLTTSGDPTIVVENGGTLNVSTKTSFLMNSGSPGLYVNGAVNATGSMGIYVGGTAAPTISINNGGTLNIGSKTCVLLGGGNAAITINSGGSMTVGPSGGLPVTAGSCTLQVNGTLNLSDKSSINVSGGSLAVTVANGGIVNDPAANAGIYGATITVQNGGTYNMTGSGGVVPSATWQDGSTLLVSNAGRPGGGFNQSFYDLIWNAAAQSSSEDGLHPANMVVRRNFTIESANGQVVKNFPGSNSVSIGGDLAITNATFNLCGAGVAGGTLSITGNLSVASGAALDVSGSVTSPVKINFVGGGSHTFFQGGTINVATREAWLVDSGNTVTLSGGNIVINGGAIQSAVTNNGTLILGANAITSSSTTNGLFVMGPGATLKLGGAIGIGVGGNVSIINRTDFTSLFLDPAANYEFNGSMAQVSGANFSGTVNDLTVNNSEGVGLSSSVSANGTVSLTVGILDLSGNNLNAAQLSSSGTISNSTGSGTLTYGSSGNSVSFGGALTDGGGGGGSTLGLTKSGSGTLTLTASNPYHGGTVISDGTLALSGSGTIGNSPTISLTGSSATFDVSGVTSGFTLNSGQTLSGIGVVTGAVTVASGGGIAPGTSPGTIVFTNDLTLGGGSTTYFELDNLPNPSDKVEVGGNLTAGGSTIDITVLGSGLDVSTNTLFHYGGALSGTFNPTVVVHGVISGIGSLQYDSVNKNVNFVVTALSVDTVAFTTPPSDTAAGATISPAVVVHVSSGGSPVGGAYVTVSLTNGTGTLSGTTVRQTDGSGDATFNDLSIDLAGVKMLEATCGSVSNASASFVITNGAAAKLAIVQQPSAEATAGVVFAQQPTVQVVDAFGNVVSNSSATIAVKASRGTLQGTTNVTANGTDGTATFTDLAVTAAGVIHLTFSSADLSSTNSANITNSAGTATQLVITTAITSPQGGSSPFTPNPVVTVADQFGNYTTSNAVIDAYLDSTDGSGTLGGTTEATATGGVATFTNLLFNLGDGVAEQIVVYFSSPGLTFATNGLVTVNPLAHFRSKASGNWNDTNTWEMSFDNTTWSDATNTPTAADGTITITNGIIVTNTDDVTVDEVTVESGGQLYLSPNGTLTLADGPGTDLDVYGTLVDLSTNMTITGTVVVENGGLYQLAKNAGPIITATWNVGSTCEITGFTTYAGSPSGMGQAFHHFTFNSPALANNNNFVGALTTVNGNLTFKSFNGRYQKLAGSQTSTLNVGGDFIIDPGSGGRLSLLNSSGSETVNVGGSVYVLSGTFQLTDSGSATGILNVSNGFYVASGATLGLGTAGTTKQINFVGSGTQTYTNGGTVSGAITWTVNSGSTLDVGTSVISGTSATFTLSTGGGLKIGSPDGIAATAPSGNIQVTGARSYSSSADYTYNGVVAQVPGDGLPATVNNLTIENPAGLTLNTTITVNGICTVAGSGLLKGNGTVNGVMVIDGTLAPGTSIGTFTVGNSPTLNGTLDMEISSPSSADKLVVSGNPLTYGGTLTVNNIGGAFTGGEVFDLFDASSFNGSFTTLNLPAVNTGQNWYTGSLTNDGTILLNHAPTATSPRYNRDSGSPFAVPISDLGTDPDAGQSVFLAGTSVTTTNGAMLTNDATYIYVPASTVDDSFNYTIHDGHGGTNAGTVLLIVVAGVNGQGKSVLTANGTATVSFVGASGREYVTQRATNLVEGVWMNIATNKAPANGLFEVTDTFDDLGGTNHAPASAYYRLLSQ